MILRNEENDAFNKNIKSFSSSFDRRKHVRFAITLVATSQVIDILGTYKSSIDRVKSLIC